MGVTVASQIERLARFIPGVAGYQDRENARATDKELRMRLVQELRRLVQVLDDHKARLAEARDFSALPRLDRLAGRLERLSRTVEFASRGYSGLFDLHPVDAEALAQLYAFDLGLFEALHVLRARVEAVRAADPAGLVAAALHMGEALDDLEQLWDQRQRTVDAG